MVGAVYLAINDSILFPGQVRESTSMESLGKVSQSTNIVKRKYSKDVNWHELSIQDDIFEADSIFTENNANAEITFTDGSKLYIDPATLLTITKKDNKSSIDIRTGSISSKLQKGNELSITSQGKTQQVRGDNSQIQFNVSESGKSELTVLSGDVKLKSGNQEQTIQKNQVAIIDDQGNVRDVQQIAIELKKPINDYTVWQKISGSPIDFSYTSEESFEKYTIEIAADVNFKNILKSTVTNQTEETLSDLPINRIVYWRVIGKSQGKEKRSPIFRLKIMADTPPQLVFPKNRSKVLYRPPENLFTKDEVKKGTEVNMRWASQVKAPFYALDIAKDENFKEIIFADKTADFSIRTTQLPPGIYYWRVFAIYAPDIRSDSSIVSTFKIEPKLSKQDIFNLLQLNKLPAPIPATEMRPLEGTYEKDNQESYDRAPKVLHLTWNQIEGASKYVLQISKTSEFEKSSTVQKFSDVNFFPVKISAPGKYFWKVAGVSEQNKEGDYSEISTFLIKEENKLFPPNLRTAGMPKSIYKIGDDYSIAWENVKNAEFYQIEVAFDSNFEEIIFDKKTSQTNFSFKIKVPKNHFIRARSINETMQDKLPPSSYSMSLVVNVDQSVMAPTITNKEAVLPTNIKNFINWTTVPNVTSYLVEYSLDSDFDDIKSFETKDTKHQVPFNKAGSYYTRVAGIMGTDSSKIKGEYSNTYSFTLKTTLSAPRISYFKDVDPVFFIWQNVEGAANYEVEFYHKGIRKYFKSKTSDTNYKLSKFPKGNYWWRIRALSEDGFPGAFTSKKDFTIEHPGRMGICKKELSSELLEKFKLDKITIDKETNCLIIEK